MQISKWLVFKTVFTCLLILVNLNLGAQVYQTNVEQVRKEVRSKNINEDDVLKRLEARGYSVLDIQNASPEEQKEIEKEIEDIISEIEAEKNKDVSTEEINQETLNDVNEAVSASETKNVEEIKSPKTEVKREIETSDNQLSQIKSVVFGHNFFRDNSIGVFDRNDNAVAPSNYIIAVGDEISIAIYGRSQFSSKYLVKEGGYIQVSDIGRIYLQGLTFGKAKELLLRKFGNYYAFTEEQFSATLIYSRTLNISVVGEVFKPGTYSLPALNSAYNVLVAAGGPTNIGSVRNINVVDASGKSNKLDVYKFLFKPEGQTPLFLQDGDFISVPVLGNIVSVSGDVRRPMKYEMLSEETIGDLLVYCGGLNDEGEAANFRLTRTENNQKKLYNLNLKEAKRFKLLDGDILDISFSKRQIDNLLEVIGDVKNPGKFSLKSGMRLLDLVSEAELLRSSRTDFAYLKRINADQSVNYIFLNIDKAKANPNGDQNLLLQRDDQLKIFSRSEYLISGKVRVVGAVKEPKEFSVDDKTSLTLGGVIELSGGLQPWAVPLVLVERTLPERPDSSEVIRVTLSGTEKNNFELRQNDVVRVLSKKNYLNKATISVEGAVRNPMELEYTDNTSLEDVLLLAGGFAFGADQKRIDIYSVDLKANPIVTTLSRHAIETDLFTSNSKRLLKPFDKVIVRFKEDFRLPEYIELRGEVAFPGEYALVGKQDNHIVSVIERAGGISEDGFPPGATLYRKFNDIGYVAIRLDQALLNKNSNYNVVLKKGDVIEVPKTMDLVTIIGKTNLDLVSKDEIVNTGKISATFLNGKRAQYYVNEYAGGFGKDADKSKLTVTYPNGQTKKTRNFGLFRVYPKVKPGSVVKVPLKEKDPEKEKREKEREPIDWNKVAANVIAQAVSILTLITLIDRIN